MLSDEHVSLTDPFGDDGDSSKLQVLKQVEAGLTSRLEAFLATEKGAFYSQSAGRLRMARGQALMAHL